MDVIIKVNNLGVSSIALVLKVLQVNKIRIFDTGIFDYTRSQILITNIINSNIFWRDYIEAEIILRG